MTDPAPVPVRHRRIVIDGIDTFYREAGPADAPVVLLPHGYPCSSYAFRNLLPALGDRWRLLAPDLPGFGHSATPAPRDFGSGCTTTARNSVCSWRCRRPTASPV